jgi:flagellar protein FlbB
MAEAGAGLRIFVLILLIIALTLGGIIWFDYLGIVNAREQFVFFYSLIKREKIKKIEDIDSALLLDNERYSKMKEALDLKEEELNKRNEELNKLAAEIEQKRGILDEKEKALEEKENSFNTQTRLYENKIANLEQISRYLTGMPPVTAKNILLQLNDQDVIDIMRVTERLALEAGETSIVSYWLSLMPSERSAAVQRKMSIKPVEIGEAIN